RWGIFLGTLLGIRLGTRLATTTSSQEGAQSDAQEVAQGVPKTDLCGGQSPVPMVFDGRSLLADLDPSKITIATVTSHTSLQIFHGARLEGFRTMGICVGEPPRYFE